MKKKILKNFVNVFRRYKNPYASLENRFIKPEKKSNKWLEALNKNLPDKSLKGYFQFAFLVNFSKLSFFEGDLLNLIDTFTKEPSRKEEIDDQIERMKNYYKNKIDDIEIMDDNNHIKVKLKGNRGKCIQATKLTRCFSELKEQMPLLLTDERDQKCHGISCALLPALPKASVVTGKVYLWNRQATYLHSWLEQDFDGETFVLDGEINALMTKKDFYKMYHAKPLEKISHQQYMQDKEVVKRLWNKEADYIKLYLSSRDEFMEIAKDEEKQKKLER